VIDVGGGASALVDALLARGCENLTVLDTSTAALDVARARLPSA
jgi:methylase of polypeptide subunit release factors